MNASLFDCLAVRDVGPKGRVVEMETPHLPWSCLCANSRSGPAGSRRRASRAARRIVLTGLCSIILVLAVAGVADAYTVNGGSEWQRQMVKEVLSYNPELLAVVEQVWPDFTVNINYGGRAVKGSIDVNINKEGLSFTDVVIHEFGHEVQLAADAKGGCPEIDCAWDLELTERGYPESTWVYECSYPYYGRRNPFECFTENLSLLWPANYHYAPDTQLAKLTAREMRAFLVNTGVQQSDGTDVTYEAMRGVDRYDTAVQISQKAFPSPFAAGTGAVVLASGESFQQALCGAPLAKAYGGVLLLTPDGLLTSQVSNEIIRLNSTKVFIIGMSSAIKAAVQTAVPGATVTAIGTSTTDVYEISLRVAQALSVKVPGLDTAIVVPGDNAHFPDAIAAAPLAAAKGWPILLTPSSVLTPVLNTYAAQAINTLGITKVIEAGTRTDIPAGVAVTRIVGLDRYDTAARVAEYSATQGLSFAHLGIATGEKFPDALAAGPYLAQDNGVMLLTPLSGLSSYASASITARAGEVVKASYFAMISSVTHQVSALLP